MSGSYHHLIYTSVARFIWPGCKKSVAEIARHLGRHRSTIYRELQRNTFYHEDHFNNGYFPLNAQELTRRRRSKLKKLNRMPGAQGLGDRQAEGMLVAGPDCRYLKRQA